MAVHLTSMSSSYWENSWAWAADRDLDGWDGLAAPPSPAGGFFIEATKGTWMLGWGVEHFALYQVLMWNAANVFVGMQMGETAGWQGWGNEVFAPKPWGEKELLMGEPRFGWCSKDDPVVSGFPSISLLHLLDAAPLHNHFPHRPWKPHA